MNVPRTYLAEFKRLQLHVFRDTYGAPLSEALCLLTREQWTEIEAGRATLRVQEAMPILDYRHETA